MVREGDGKTARGEREVGGGRGGAESKGRGPVRHRLYVPAPAPHPGAEAICTLLCSSLTLSAAENYTGRARATLLPHLGLVCAATQIVGRALHAMHLLLLLVQLLLVQLLLVKLLLGHMLYLGEADV